MKKALLDFSIGESKPLDRATIFLKEFYKRVGKRFEPISEDDFETFMLFLQVISTNGEQFEIFGINKNTPNFPTRYLYLFLSLCDDEQINRIVRAKGLLSEHVCDIITSRNIVLESKQDVLLDKFFGITLLNLTINEDDTELEEFLIQTVLDSLIKGKFKYTSYVDVKYSGNKKFLKRLTSVLEQIDPEHLSSIYQRVLYPMIRTKRQLFTRNGGNLVALGKFIPKKYDFKEEEAELLRVTSGIFSENQENIFELDTLNYMKGFDDFESLYNTYLTSKQIERMDTFLDRLVVPIVSIYQYNYSRRSTPNNDTKEPPYMYFDRDSFFKSFFDKEDTEKEKTIMLSSLLQKPLDEAFIRKITGLYGSTDMLLKMIEGRTFPIYFDYIIGSLIHRLHVGEISGQVFMRTVVNNPEMFTTYINEYTREQLFTKIIQLYIKDDSLDRNLVKEYIQNFNLKTTKVIFPFSFLLYFKDVIPEELFVTLDRENLIQFPDNYFFYSENNEDEKIRYYPMNEKESKFPKSLASKLNFYILNKL